ncbi:MAG: cell division protein SepF [Leptolyngbyaceae cyanobacterium SL_7_1]|nr:cell division protein SepF [Leptolyngbyaceae cyanobacterium SL_7_1]
MNLFQRLQSALGMGEPLEEAYYEPGFPDSQWRGLYFDPGSTVDQTPPVVNKVVGMPGISQGQTEVVLMKPQSFEEIPQAVLILRDRKSLVLDLSLLEADQAQRCADYVAGGAFAIDGHQERLSDKVFLFTPNFVQISSYANPALPDPLLGDRPANAAMVSPHSFSPITQSLASF